MTLTLVKHLGRGFTVALNVRVTCPCQLQVLLSLISTKEKKMITVLVALHMRNDNITCNSACSVILMCHSYNIPIQTKSVLISEKKLPRLYNLSLYLKRTLSLLTFDIKVRSFISITPSITDKTISLKKQQSN